MKKALLILIVCFISLFSAYSQPKVGFNREKIQSMKIAFMTDKVCLTPGESEKFWPLYNQYWGERRELAHRMRGLFERVDKGSVDSKVLDEFLELRDLENGLLRRWSVEFKKVLSADKVLKVFVAEENFKHYLLTQRPEAK